MHATQPATFADFEREARADGYDEILVRDWLPNQVVGTHSHPFDAKALVVRGEMDLTTDGRTQHISAGGGFALARDVPHDERYGPEGATYWVARRR